MTRTTLSILETAARATGSLPWEDLEPLFRGVERLLDERDGLLVELAKERGEAIESLAETLNGRYVMLGTPPDPTVPW